MTLKLTFLGHAGYLLETANHKVAIDPYLTDNPVAVMKAEELDCTHIVVTHGHFDHFADVPAIAKRTGATVVAPVEICEYLSSDEGGNHEKCEPGAPGGKIVTDFGFVAFVQAMHGSSFKGRYMGPACGVVVQIGGKKLYHA
ncbi:MAG: MBL fold metallo-hydrolase, partial [Planctomycetota bacterium]